MASPKIFSNWKVVTLSFLGATTFWFFSALGKQYNTRITYPIEFVYDADSLIAIKPLTEKVDIDVSGGGWDVLREGYLFGADPIRIDLENPASIRFLTRATILPILTDQLNQFTITYLYTDTLFIDIDRKISKKVNLTIDSLSISMDDNYRIVSPITISPDTAIIYGPSSYIDTLQKTLRVDLDVSGIDKDFDRFVKLGLLDDHQIISDPTTTKVNFEVERFDQLEIETQVELLNFPDDSSVFVTNPEVSIKFVSRRSLEQEYFAEDFKIIVDYELINKRDSIAPAIILFHPETALDVEVAPDSLDITYVK
ncbi:MAG: hypothetical protein AB8B73_15430 [Ekhidna sp.]